MSRKGPVVVEGCAVLWNWQGGDINVHRSGVIMYKNNYLWLNLVYVGFMSCYK